jgi:hypothetical protein
MSSTVPAAFHGVTALAIALTLPAVAHATLFSCRPFQVIEYSDRINVSCRNSIALGSDTVTELAIPNNNDLRAQRYVAQATAAVMARDVFRVDVPESSSSNTSGCGTSDCRTPGRFGVAP